VQLFAQQEVDLSTFLTLSENDLKELGVSTFGARRKMTLGEWACFAAAAPFFWAGGGGGGSAALCWRGDWQ
jgi:hypothetical protein